MIAGIRSVTAAPTWKALEAHYQKVRELHLRKLFADDPKRGERMTIEAQGIYLDYSKNRITDETLKLLLQLAEECDCGRGSMPRLEARRLISRKTEPSCTWRSARIEGHPLS